jgi:hypothetical protein
MLDVGSSTFSFSHPKKVPPPTSDGREGRLFPPEQSSKVAELLTELKRRRNKIFNQFTRNDWHFAINYCANDSLRELIARVLILHAQHG